MFSQKDIARYYDLSESQYRFFWNLDKSLSLHYGYWDDSTKNFHEALLNINKVLSAKAAISKDDKVLDAGCGIGGSSIWLAKNIGCIVTGISLSEKQVNKANALGAREGVEHLAGFEQKDFTATGFPSESFDVVWAIESVCHATDKSAFLKEVSRLLKKNGRLIMADFFKKENLDGKDAQQVQQWAHGWAVEDFSTKEEFERQLQQAGFLQIKIEDVSHTIMPSAKRLYRSYFIGRVLGFLYRLINRNPAPQGKKNIDTAWLQYKTLKKNLWKYLIISAEKN
ncbi:MAG: SAM-dependent methyltransferase [Chitinophagaceae bacterium]|nr:SAM-dependent methyltransferase [Chitinophagaceae bacterium]